MLALLRVSADCFYRAAGILKRHPRPCLEGKRQFIEKNGARRR
jgi:hypothetical protein